MSTQMQIAQAAVDLIEEHLLDGEVTQREIAQAVHVSLPYLHKLFATYVGMGMHEYRRLRRLSKAALELRNGTLPVLEIALKYGYSSQEAFTVAFAQVLGATPGSYRKAESPPAPWGRPDLLRRFLHRAAHEAADEGLLREHPVQMFLMPKPACKVIAKVNRDGTPSHRFFDECEENGTMQRLDGIAGVVFSCGLLLTCLTPALLAYVGEVSMAFSGEVPAEFELLEIPASEYVVFFHPRYPTEDHGSVMHSVWKASQEWNPEEYGIRWNKESAPVWIHDDQELGFFLYLPVQKLL